MKKTICLLMICISTICNAQIATTNWSYQLDRFIEIKNSDDFNEIINLQIRSVLKKVVNHTDLEGNPNSFLGTILVEQIENEELNIYKDKNCTQQIPKNKIQDVLYEFNGFDTILTFHPETFEEDTFFLNLYIKQIPNDSTTYNVSQEWYFDTTTQQLYSQINKIAIEQIIDSSTLFYLKNENVYTSPNENLLDKKNITWARRIVMMCDFRNTEIERYLFNMAHLKKHRILYRDSQYDLFREISVDSFLLLEYMDLDKVPYMYGNTVILSNVRYCKIIQDLYYDSEAKTFSTRLIGICLTTRNIGAKGKPLWSKERFWLMYDESLPYDDASDKIYNEWSGCGRKGWWK